ncbi:MAG TPA: hypothetical protein VGO93_00945 [Candidatus Xenobia bacterium]|jgi:hypothetical protein
MSALDTCRTLPQSGEEWTVDTRTDQTAEPLSLWAALGRDELRGFTVGSPSDAEFAELLSTILANPTEGEPCRPRTVVVATAEEKHKLAPLLAELDIPVAVQAPSAEATRFFDEVRPAVVQQLMLGATLPDEVDQHRFMNLVEAIEAILEIDPWSMLPAQAAFMVGGLGPDPVAVLLGREEGARAIGVVTLHQDKMPNPEEDGLWIQFVPDDILGHVEPWAHVGYADDRLLETVEQVDLLLGAAEVLVKSLGGGDKPPEEQSFVLEDWMDVPTPVQVVFLAGAPPVAKPRRRKARGK